MNAHALFSVQPVTVDTLLIFVIQNCHGPPSTQDTDAGSSSVQRMFINKRQVEDLHVTGVMWKYFSVPVYF